MNLINEKLLKKTILINGLGQLALKMPCLNFCQEVIVRCIGKDLLEQLNDSWKNYVGSLAELANKLTKSYNFDTIVEPLDVQISEAIMNFQENGKNISDYVFSICGRPSQNRLNNNLAASSIRTNPIGLHNQHQHQQLQHHHMVNQHHRQGKREASLQFHSPNKLKSSSLIEEIRHYMLTTKSFWANLPNAVCTSNHTLGPKQNCIQEPLNPLDTNFDMRYRNEFTQTISQLTDIAAKIKRASEGEEIEWESSINSHTLHASININPHNINTINRAPQLPILASTSSTPTPGPTEDDDIDNTEDPEDIDGSSGIDYPGPEDPTEPDDTELIEDTQTSSPDDLLTPTETTLAPEDINSNLIEQNAQKSSAPQSKLVRAMTNAFDLTLVSSVVFAIMILLV